MVRASVLFSIQVPSLTLAGWNKGGNKDRLREVYKDFDPSIDTLLSYVDPNDLKLWDLLDMEVLPSWVNERLALLGDAAHPFLPRKYLLGCWQREHSISYSFVHVDQGQGGAQAIEDAASLAVMLPRDTPKAEIPERLKLYQKCRYERANTIQDMTRLAGRDAGDMQDKEPLNSTRP